MAQLDYIKPQEQYLNWMNLVIGKRHNFVSYSYEDDYLSKIEFNEEDILQTSKQENLQQKDS
jgi:hypothetical protein